MQLESPSVKSSIKEAEAGWTQQAVANRFGVTTRAVRKWLTKRRSGEALANKPGRGWKPKLDRVSQTVVGKSLQMKGFSARKLARKLTACGRPVSKCTVLNYLRNDIHAVPYVERTPSEKMSKAIFQQGGASILAKGLKNGAPTIYPLSGGKVHCQATPQTCP